jgi:hypothetical protein
MIKYHICSVEVSCEDPSDYGQNKESFVTMPDFLFA